LFRKESRHFLNVGCKPNVHELMLNRLSVTNFDCRRKTEAQVLRAALYPAYETLLYDAMIGDASLFKRGDVMEAGWSVVEPVLKAWENPLSPLSFYPAGSEGPEAAAELLRRDGYEWMGLM
jgi:glucose-6-phosphate 1-dehydrogenase